MSPRQRAAKDHEDLMEIIDEIAELVALVRDRVGSSDLSVKAQQQLDNDKDKDGQ